MKLPHPLFRIPDPPGPAETVRLEDLRDRIDKLGRFQVKMQALLESRLGEREDSRFQEDVLKLLDGLDEAIATMAGQVDERISGYRQGLDLMRRKALERLEKAGISVIPSVGRPFDPALHVAVGTAQREGVPDHVILEEDRRGYRRGSEVLRLSEVVVNRKRAGR